MARPQIDLTKAFNFPNVDFPYYTFLEMYSREGGPFVQRDFCTFSGLPVPRSKNRLVWWQDPSV